MRDRSLGMVEQSLGLGWGIENELVGVESRELLLTELLFVSLGKNRMRKFS